ncbi:hypothetical protein LPJ72_006274, partial [Coemansia sp. Benny D160-2]
VHAYLKQVVGFKEKLAVLLHITSGQPARAPELLSTQHVNTETNRHCNIFIENGLVTLVTAYHKSFYVTNDLKIINRYVPSEVGELVVYYLWLVQPFVDQLEVWLKKQLPAPQQQPTSTSTSSSSSTTTHESALLWGPDPGTKCVWSSDRFCEVFKQETEQHLGQAVNPAAYHHIAIGISRRYMQPNSQFSISQDEQEDNVNDPDNETAMGDDNWYGHISDLQAAHSSHTAGLVYGHEIMDQAGMTAQ